jgi:hypothetical protein
MSNTFPFRSVPQTAVLLGICDGLVRQLLIAGELRGQKLGVKHWVIHVRDIERCRKKRLGQGKKARVTK